METTAFASSFESNLKKAYTEFLFLSILAEGKRYIGELPELIKSRSSGDLTLTFPYSAIYRLLKRGYIQELGAENAPDNGRRRTYYSITDTGRRYAQHLAQINQRFTRAVDAIINP